jgi:hypothetical protein
MNQADTMIIVGLFVGIVAGFAGSSFLHWRAGRWNREQRQRLEEDYSAMMVERDRLADELERRGAAKIERDALGAVRQVVVVRPSHPTEPESHSSSMREHGRDRGMQGR